MRRGTGAIAVALALAACGTKTIELGAPDAPGVHADAHVPACRCRLAPCRGPSDCTLIGGACGSDGYCVGDLGACTTATQCAASATCTAGSDSTDACAE